MEPVTAARVALLVNKHKKPLALLVAVFVLAPLVMVGSIVVGAAALLGVASANDDTCTATTAAAAASLPDPIGQAAVNLGAAPTTATLLIAFATARAAAVPVESITAAGPFRLGSMFAAGSSGTPGRWQGPLDPAQGRDSRSDATAATRAVIRRFHRAAPQWPQIRSTPAPTTEQERTALAQSFAAAALAAFGTPLDVASVAAALAAPSTTSQTPTGDARAGGVVVIGDPTRAATVAAILGPRAFGGPVTVSPTVGDPATVGDALERDLAAATGTLIAVVDTVPTPAQADTLQEATPAVVAWIAAQSTPNIPPTVRVAATTDELRAALVDLASGTDAASQFFALCGSLPGLGLDEGESIDPATIVAPDPQAQVAIAYAHAQLGEPYVTDPPRARPPDSWDCSKLTTAAWAQAGVRLTPLSYTQANEVQAIPRAAVQPGDLVFWLRSGAHHVALVDQVDADGSIWITEAANPDAGVRRRTIGGSWDATYLSGFGRVQRTTT